MNNRNKRAQIAQQTLDILKQGVYISPSGKSINIDLELKTAIEGTKLYTPEELGDLADFSKQFATEYECTDETTFAAAARLTALGEEDIMCLNFASAKNPGGGFLGGSQAQEESLSRASGLYSCIAPMETYYQTNRHWSSCLYTDYMIYSPAVPVFRDDDDELLENFYTAPIVTAPAVNRGAVAKNEPGNLSKCTAVMSSRIEKLLGLCANEGCRTLILGAWGCGVFRNDPFEIASLFKEKLYSAKFDGVFKKVVFAIYDRSKNQHVKKSFERVFNKN